MLKFKIIQGWTLKKVLVAVANMGPNALMEILPVGLLIRVTNPSQEVTTVLKINTKAFQHYSCDKAHIFKLNLLRFSSIINSALDDEAISISRSCDSPNIFSFIFINQNGEESKNIGMEITQVEIDHWGASDESMHEFKICIKSEDFARIIEYSKLNKETINIIMMGELVILSSGYDVVHLWKENEECIIENVGVGTRHQLQVQVNKLDSLLLTSLLTSAVWIHDSHSRSPSPPCLEFPLSDLGTILVFLPQPFVIS